MTGDDLVTVKRTVRQVCRFHRDDEPEVLSRTLERLWRWYEPAATPDVTLVQATRRAASLALSEVLAEAPRDEIPVDFTSGSWDDAAPLWAVSESVMPEDELVRSEEWVDLAGSLVAGVGVRAATVVELMFRGNLRQKEIAPLLGISSVAVHKHWARAREHLRSTLPAPELAQPRKTLRSGAWGTVRGTVYHSG